jgi:hypothetical protein
MCSPRESFGSRDAKMHTSKTVKTGNKHRGSSFEDFLKQERLLENVQAAAFKRALALKVNDMMKEKRMNGVTWPVKPRG